MSKKRNEHKTPNNSGWRFQSPCIINYQSYTNVSMIIPIYRWKRVPWTDLLARNASVTRSGPPAKSLNQSKQLLPSQKKLPQRSAENQGNQAPTQLMKPFDSLHQLCQTPRPPRTPTTSTPPSRMAAPMIPKAPVSRQMNCQGSARFHGIDRHQRWVIIQATRVWRVCKHGRCSQHCYLMLFVSLEDITCMRIRM